MMMDSGARGNISNFVQLAGLRGSMAKATHEYAALKRQGIIVRNVEEIPIKSSFKTGLSTFEYFLSTHGARKGLSDTATKTAESGYLTRRLVEAAQDIHIHEEDCGTDKGVEVKEIYDTRTGATIETLYDRIIGRYLSEDIRHEGKKIASKDDFVTPELANKIVDAGVKKV
jgi:DNA-directed RNA polymerase subunit beta'